jgi:hypothetical protein
MTSKPKEFSNVLEGLEGITQSYNVQNVLVDQYNFPQFYYEGDTIHSMYTDRMQMWDIDKYTALIQKNFGRDSVCWSDALDQSKVKRFLEDYIGEPIDGYRNVRFTNVNNGYPVFRFDTYRKGGNSPE